MSDQINSPAHYTQAGIECIDAIAAATVGKCGIESLRKAAWYLDRLIAEVEGRK